MWNLPRPVIKPMSPALAGKPPASGPPGKSNICFLTKYFWIKKMIRKQQSISEWFLNFVPHKSKHIFSFFSLSALLIRTEKTGGRNCFLLRSAGVIRKRTVIIIFFKGYLSPLQKKLWSHTLIFEKHWNIIIYCDQLNLIFNSQFNSVQLLAFSFSNMQTWFSYLGNSS